MDGRKCLYYFTLLLGLSCQSRPENTPTAPIQSTTIQWIDSNLALGNIAMGDTVLIGFRFRNTGDHPLVIRQIQTDCSCSSSTGPEQPVLPGDTGTIHLRFDTRKSITGSFFKQAQVTANTAPKDHFILRYKGEITGHR
jgi:hypothetical protein